MKDITKELTKKRLAGILLHPTSLPSPYGIGDVGPSAYDFVDFLYRSGQHLWQILPIGPVDDTNSPYNSACAFAGNPLLISPVLLRDDGFLTDDDISNVPFFPVDRVDYPKVKKYKHQLLHTAFERFCLKRTTDSGIEEAYCEFCNNNLWLKSYADYMCEKDPYDFSDSPEFECFIQWQFFCQWIRLKNYANEHGILIIGDIPIFVAADGVDIKNDPKLFLLDDESHPSAVSGVPPDYFCPEGQLWGNPIYNWEYHKSTGYEWWVKRIAAQLKLCDIIRIDHFRGFESYWEIPADAKNALSGRWMPGPGKELFDKIKDELGQLPIIAEDLGIITDEVRKLRDDCELPGMKVLHFAFEDDNSSYLPYNQPVDCVCYTGTHDNDTSRGYYEHASEAVKDKIRRYMNTDAGQISWDFIRTAFGTAAKYAIVPMQDLLCQGSESRMNTPGSTQGNWEYRIGSIPDQYIEQRLYDITKLFGR